MRHRGTRFSAVLNGGGGIVGDIQTVTTQQRGGGEVWVLIKNFFRFCLYLVTPVEAGLVNLVDLHLLVAKGGETVAGILPAQIQDYSVYSQVYSQVYSVVMAGF